MSSAHDPTKVPTVAETEKQKDSLAETIAYARRTYKGNHPDVKTFEPEKYGLALQQSMSADGFQQRACKTVLQQH